MFVVNDNLVMLEEIPRLSNYWRVSVRVKVMAEEEAIEVKKGLVKQEYAIADATASCKIVTWKDNTGVLQPGNSYKLSGLMVRMYNGKSIPQFLRMAFRYRVLRILEWWRMLKSK